MLKSDVACPDCSAGYRRIELESRNGKSGHYKCLVCDRVLEVFDGSREVAYRLTVQPSNLHPERHGTH
jgi:transposase-like protein